jgi:RecA/RadA recombinase
MTNKLMEKILKNSPTKYASVLSKSATFDKKDIISTDIPIINVAFSGEVDGGIYSGLTLLAGPSKTFKTNVALVCVRAYLSKYKDSVCVLYDSEGGITPDYLKSQGIDPSRVVHIPIEHLEMLKFDIVKQLKELERGDKVIFVIDSIGNTASLKELQDALDEKTVAEMQRAKVIKGLFRMVTPSLVNKDIPCIAVCHTYETMELYSRPVISGGSGLIYSANQAFIISKAQEKIGTDLVGWNFTLNVEKSRFVREKSKFMFTVLYDRGIQKYSGLLDIAIKGGFVVKPSLGWYSRVVDGKQEEKKWRAKDVNTEEFWSPILENDDFKNFVADSFKLTSNSPIKDTSLEYMENLEDETEE